MRLWSIVSLMPLIGLSGCAPASFGSASGLQGVAAAVESLGSAATGFKSSQSAVELNGANRDLAEAQAASLRGQTEEAALDHQRIDHERITTTKLLREMSETYHDAILLTLAEWVESGGDPDFAFKYALSHVDEDSRTKVIPQQTFSLNPEPARPSQPQLPPPDKSKASSKNKASPKSKDTSSQPPTAAGVSAYRAPISSQRS